ncbi:MAG TPA: M20 family metallopeptidase [Bacillota bacterium]|nr:M20 family metallopeptidase [Bacillota bacterium]
MKDKLTKYRRELHRIPELGYELYETRAYIMEQLKQYDCEIAEVCGGICAFFQSKEEDGKGGRRENTVALRSDMDALPIVEKTGLPYRSAHEGAMHACGHDGHMSMLLALAGELDRIIHTLPHNVLLIFQPAEETTGGAEDMCAAGILSKYGVKRIYGFHLWPMLPKNAIGSRPNGLMAKSSELDIVIEGKSVHCASAEEGTDALAIGCEMVNELYRMEKTEIPAMEYCLLKFGRMESGTVRNAISAKTVLQGSVRRFNEDTGDFMFRRIEEISASYEGKYGCRISFIRTDGHPAVINDPVLFAEAKKLLSDYEFHTFEKPFLLSEDFSCYQERVPGLFLFLGTGTGIPLHSDTFDFDEKVLCTGVNVYLKLLKSISL